MGFIPCVDQQDPFTRKVRATYRANVVRAPRTGIQPLDALAVRKTVVQPRGRLAVMIDGEPVELPKSHQDKVAALSGELSTAVDLGLGIDLTAKFFTALGIPIPSAQASATLWQNAHQIRFEVLDVVQHQVDVSELGLAVNGRGSPATPRQTCSSPTRRHSCWS